MSPARRRWLVSASCGTRQELVSVAGTRSAFGNSCSVIFIFSALAFLVLKPLVLSPRPPVWVTALVFDETDSGAARPGDAS